MIKYALHCSDCDHAFESWFASSQAFETLVEQKLVECPSCASASVLKQIMAPAVRTRSASTKPDPADMMKTFAKAAREHIAENCDYVGDNFASEARAMYYGDIDQRAIWGETTPEERKALREEGVPASPLPAPFAPTPPKQKTELN